MTAERWGQIKSLVAEAMEIPAADRVAYVARACGQDDLLREEVNSLLAAGDGPDSLPELRGAIASSANAMIEDGDASVRSVLDKALGHQYEILRPLGRGGMGEVYLARERALERFVAIKVLHPDLAATPESRERFRREARMAAQLSHPGILTLHTFGEVGGVWYFVMEYVRGPTLGERIRIEGRISPAEAHGILVELADALDCAHRHGIVHRDIKPANILLDEESGHAVLADFGISKSSDTGDSLTGTGVIIGTPDFMSPEQALGSSDVDARSDIYSLGAVAYTMLAGRGPFAAASTQQILYRRLSQDAAPLQSVAPAVPEELASIVMKCLARDAALRWQDARSLRDALARAGGAESLPEQLRELPSFGPYALLWAVAWSALAFLTVRQPGERVLLLLIAVLVPVGLLLHVWSSGGQGFRLVELVRVASWPPVWWSMWWPSALRRPSDMWRRLPWWPAKLVRVMVSAFFIAAPVIIALRQRLGPDEELASSAAAHAWLNGVQWLLVLGTAATLIGAFWWARLQGFASAEATRFLLGATSASRFWNTTRVARLLTQPRGRVRPPDRESPTDHRRAIAELARLLPPNPSIEVGKVASDAAERGLRAIEAHDREIESLLRDAGAAEPDRLAAQLALLGETKAEESTERRELRDLLQHQLDVARRVRDLHEAAKEKRGRKLDLLRGLWTQMCVVHESAAESQEAQEAARRLHAICAEI